MGKSRENKNVTYYSVFKENIFTLLKWKGLVWKTKHISQIITVFQHSFPLPAFNIHLRCRQIEILFICIFLFLLLCLHLQIFPSQIACWKQLFPPFFIQTALPTWNGGTYDSTTNLIARKHTEWPAESYNSFPSRQSVHKKTLNN